MKLKEYNLKTIQLQKPRLPYVRLNSKSGCFFISSEALLLLNKEHKAWQTKVEVLQDEDRKTDWYLVETTNENGFLLKTKDKFRSGLFFINKQLIAKIFSDCGITENSVQMLVSKEPILHDGRKLLAIITKSAKV